jgi:FkbM family methyltransferase
MKAIIKSLIKKLPVAFTKNQKYDRQTRQVIRIVCNHGSNCVDVGCHKGEILDHIKRTAPKGTHHGFEPIPELFEKLNSKYKNTNCIVHQLAVSNKPGKANFNYVISNPSYSGFKKRKYDRPNEKDIEITVDTDILDNIIPHNLKIDFIKIDVEGAELLVLEGAERLIKKDKPVIVFEYGIGGSDFYEPDPGRIYLLLNDYGLSISLLDRWLKKLPSLTLEEFKTAYYQKLNFFFIAYRGN